MGEKTCIIISGPTASGKTAHGIALALKHKTEIISADSRQCFREMSIGVAKPSKDELEMVKHHFIDSHSIHEKVDVKVFESYALSAVNQIFEKNDIAIMVGGTGLYIRAFVEGLDEIPEIDTSIRIELNQQYEANGMNWLKSRVEAEDPLFFAKGENQNPQRMLRALEVKRGTGKSILDFHSGKKNVRPFKVQNIYLSPPREDLYHRINTRVDQMMNEGLLEEAQSLFSYRHLNALQTVGYRELFDFMEGNVSLDQAVDLIKKNTRHFAKRQNTWFKKYLEK